MRRSSPARSVFLAIPGRACSSSGAWRFFCSSSASTTRGMRSTTSRNGYARSRTSIRRSPTTSPLCAHFPSAWLAVIKNDPHLPKNTSIPDNRPAKGILVDSRGLSPALLTLVSLLCCVNDGTQKCSPGMVFDGVFCQCAPGTMRDPSGDDKCLPCEAPPDAGGRAPLCGRVPTGQGMACQVSADCAGTEATYCEAVQLKQCLVEGCDTAANDCSSGYLCC